MSAESDDDALLHAAVAGAADALESLLMRHFDALVADIARRIPEDVRSALSAEDVLQDAFIVAFQRVRTFEPQGGGAFYAWLLQIAENRLMDAAKALRAAKRGGGWERVNDAANAGSDDLIPLLELLPTHSRTPSHSAAQREVFAVLTAALDALEPDYREVLRLRYLEMSPVAVCAERLQRSEGAVHMLLSRALAALRVRMGDTTRFFTRTA